MPPAPPFALLGGAMVLALWAGCRSPVGGEKGGLVTVRMDPRTLSQVYQPRRFALVVGVGTFSDAAWRPLRYAVKDATDLSAALTDPARGAFAAVRTLTSPADTSRPAILAALDALGKKADRADDIVVVYLSAHGTLGRDVHGELRRYLVTSDARLDALERTALPVDLLKVRFDHLSSRRRLLVLATCHSGSGKSLLPESVLEELATLKAGFFERPLEEASRASLVFSACDWGETAREDRSLENDIYTHFFVEALGGAGDRNADGAVTATEAHDYARRRTFVFTEGRQRPSAEILEVGADPLILSGALARSGQPELFSYDPRLDGVTLKVDGDERTELPGGAAVKPGRRRVELVKGGTTWLNEEVELRTGQRLELGALLHEQAPRHSLSLVAGGFGFLDARSRHELLPLSAALGLSLRLDDLPFPRLGLVFDVHLSSGRQSLDLAGQGAVPFEGRSLSVGVAVPYLWKHGRLTLLAGPRVAGLVLERSFLLETYRGTQRTLTVTPGMLAGASYSLTPSVELSLQSELMLTYLVVDGQSQGLGFFGGWAGVGYRF